MKINRTVMRTAEILQYISKKRRGYTLNELYLEMEIPKTSIYDILVTLVEAGMLMKSPDDPNRYVIGLKTYEVGNQYMGQNSLQINCKHHLIELSRDIGYTALLAVENNNEIVYMSKHEADDKIITTVILGSRNDMYSTALGKAILAGYTNENIRDRYKDVEFSVHNSKTINNVDDLIAKIERIRKKGYAISLGENNDERITSVACPIYGVGYELLGAICVTGMYRSCDDVDVIGGKILKVAKILSKELGSSEEFYSRLKS